MEQQLNNKTMIVAHKEGQVHEYDLVGSFSASSCSSLSGMSSGSSLKSYFFEEVTSFPTSFSSSSVDQHAADPLSDMSSLLEQLPIK